MSEQQHTKGPWHVFDNREDKDFERYDAARIGVGSVVGSDIAHCYGFNSSRRDEEVLANARLIAAAPDLLTALENLYALVQGECPSLLEDDHHDVMVSAAIAKATRS